MSDRGPIYAYHAPLPVAGWLAVVALATLAIALICYGAACLLDWIF